MSTPTVSSPILRWPERLFGPAPGLKEINFVCWACFFAFLVLPIGFVLVGRARTGQPAPDADFVNFYAMGRILNEYPADQLYNTELQNQVRTQIHPLRTGSYGPLPHPPFVAILFRPVARLSYGNAYLLWLAVTLGLYLAGLFIATAGVHPLQRSLIFCFALAFYPFTIETLVNGQLSAIAFFFLALAIYEDERHRPLLSGLALSICLSKPTLLILILPMLLVTRRFRTLAGFGGGAAVLILLTTLLEGPRIWSGYINLLLSFGKTATGVVGAHSILPLAKYVDLAAFTALLPGGRSWIGLAAVSFFVLSAMLFLLRIWWKSADAAKPAGMLMWSATLTWTMLANLYVPIYDSILVVLSIILSLRAMSIKVTSFRVTSSRALAHRPFPGGLNIIGLLIFASSWVTVPIAQACGLQSISLLIAALGLFQFLAWLSLSPANRIETGPVKIKVAESGAPFRSTLSSPEDPFYAGDGQPGQHL